MFSTEATIIVLRESLEGFLVIGILAGLIDKFGQPASKKYLVAGALAALAATVMLGVVSDAAAREFIEESGGEALFAASTALVAVVILTYMVVWMYRHTLSLVRDIRVHAKSAVEVGRPMMLFLIAFATVGREGIETVLFYATLAPTTSAAALILSALAGLAVSAVLALLVFKGIVRLNVQRFFAISGVLLVLFAGDLLAGAVHGFAEAGMLPEVAWLELAAQLAYVGGVGFWYLRGMRVHARGLGKAALPDA